MERLCLISSYGCVRVSGGGRGSAGFSPLGSDPDSAVKPKPYMLCLNLIMSAWVGVC